MLNEMVNLGGVWWLSGEFLRLWQVATCKDCYTDFTRQIFLLQRVLYFCTRDILYRRVFFKWISILSLVNMSLNRVETQIVCYFISRKLVIITTNSKKEKRRKFQIRIFKRRTRKSMDLNDVNSLPKVTFKVTFFWIPLCLGPALLLAQRSSSWCCSASYGLSMDIPTLVMILLGGIVPF